MDSTYQHGDHLVICDICGRQVFRSQSKYRWDGMLCCTLYNCWDPKHPIFDPLPIINDPAVLQDVRPDQVSGTETFVSDNIYSGLTTTFGGGTTNPAGTNGRIIIGVTHIQIGHVDDAPSYI